MVADTRTPLVVTQRGMTDSVLAGCPPAMIFLDELRAEDLASVSTNPEPTAGPRSLAYVLYTSGSTGRPKGVLAENRSIVRLVFNTNYCRFGPEEVFLHFAPISFDASTFEICGGVAPG